MNTDRGQTMSSQRDNVNENQNKTVQSRGRGTRRVKRPEMQIYVPRARRAQQNTEKESSENKNNSSNSMTPLTMPTSHSGVQTDRRSCSPSLGRGRAKPRQQPKSPKPYSTKKLPNDNPAVENSNQSRIPQPTMIENLSKHNPANENSDPSTLSQTTLTKNIAQENPSIERSELNSKISELHFSTSDESKQCLADSSPLMISGDECENRSHVSTADKDLHFNNLSVLPVIENLHNPTETSPGNISQHVACGDQKEQAENDMNSLEKLYQETKIGACKNDEIVIADSEERLIHSKLISDQSETNNCIGEGDSAQNVNSSHHDISCVVSESNVEFSQNKSRIVHGRENSSDLIHSKLGTEQKETSGNASMSEQCVGEFIPDLEVKQVANETKSSPETSKITCKSDDISQPPSSSDLITLSEEVCSQASVFNPPCEEVTEKQFIVEECHENIGESFHSKNTNNNIVSDISEQIHIQDHLEKVTSYDASPEADGQNDHDFSVNVSTDPPLNKECKENEVSVENCNQQTSCVKAELNHFNSDQVVHDSKTSVAMEQRENVSANLSASNDIPLETQIGETVTQKTDVVPEVDDMITQPPTQDVLSKDVDIEKSQETEDIINESKDDDMEIHFVQSEGLDITTMKSKEAEELIDKHTPSDNVQSELGEKAKHDTCISFPSTDLSSDMVHADTNTENNDSSTSEVAMETQDVDDEDSWDKMFTEEGECLDPKVLEELTAAVGSVQVEKPQATNYYKYQPKTNDVDFESHSHVVEISEFPAEFITRDLIAAFQPFMSRGFDIKWVDDTHALGIFSSSIAANEALQMYHPLLKVKPLSEADKQSKMKAKKCVEFLQPYKPRPETSAFAARRLVTGALGLTQQIPKEKRDQERQQIKAAKARRKQEKKSKEDAWEGNYGKCAMDEES